MQRRVKIKICSNSHQKRISLPELVATAGNCIIRLNFRSFTSGAPEKCGPLADYHIRHEFVVFPQNEGPRHSTHRRIGKRRNHPKDQKQYVLLTGVIAASPWRPRQPFLRSDECDQPNKNRRSVSGPLSCYGGGSRARYAANTFTRTGH